MDSGCVTDTAGSGGRYVCEDTTSTRESQSVRVTDFRRTGTEGGVPEPEEDVLITGFVINR